MSHTPGPWKSYPTPNDIDFTHEIDGVCSVNINNNSEANALLISAAPDLLAFADFVIGILKTAEICGLHLDMDKKHLLEQAKAVTRKARGK